MKRVRDPNKPRRKFKAGATRSPGRQTLDKQRLRLVSIDPASDNWLAQAAASLGAIKRRR